MSKLINSLTPGRCGCVLKHNMVIDTLSIQANITWNEY